MKRMCEEVRRMLVKCTKGLMYFETPRGSYMKHLVSLMECSGRCSGSWSTVKPEAEKFQAASVKLLEGSRRIYSGRL